MEVLDDHEQGEVVKRWLQTNGPAIVVGIVAGLGGLSGWRYWQDYQRDAQLGAARDYETLVAELESGESDAGVDRLNQFASEHDNPGYEALIALQIAGEAVADRNLEEAATLYRRAAESARPQALRHVAGLRLARVELQLGQLDKALATVDRYDEEGFVGIAAQVRGDILLAQGDREGARAAYQVALDNGAGDRALLQMKIDDLAAVQPEAAQAAPEPAAAPGVEPMEGTPEEAMDGVAPMESEEDAAPADGQPAEDAGPESEQIPGQDPETGETP